MLTLPPSVRVFVAQGPTDMRKSFDGLAEVAKRVVGEDPLSGHLFVFINRRADRVKILYWDRTGYCLFYKRLETGTFESAGRREIEMDELVMLLEGIELRGYRRRKRFSLAER